MKHYYLTAYGRNKISINTFYLFYAQNIKLPFNTIEKYFQKRKKQKILTILKSPHINKAAQEQFGYKYYLRSFSFYTLQKSKILLFLKKIKSYLFYNTKVKIKFKINKKLFEKSQADIFEPINFNLNLYKKTNTNKKIQNLIKLLNKNNLDIENINLKKLSKLIQAYDIYGEIYNTMFR